MTKEAEQFLAVLQIFLAEVASFDLCLLQTDLEIVLEIFDEDDLKIERVPSNENSLWQIKLPHSNMIKPKKVEQAHLHVFLPLVRSCLKSPFCLKRLTRKLWKHCFVEGFQPESLSLNPMKRYTVSLSARKSSTSLRELHLKSSD